MGIKNGSLTGEVDTPGHLSFFGFSKERQEQYIKYNLPAGFMTSTAEDLILFLDAISGKDPVMGLSPEGFAKVVSPYPADNFYSMGWMNYPSNDRPAVHHGGSLPGFSSNAVMLPEDEYNIAILINKNHLLNAYIYYPELTDGIINILTDQEISSKVQFFLVYRLLLVLFVITILVKTRKFVRLMTNHEAKQSENEKSNIKFSHCLGIVSTCAYSR